MPDNNIVVAVYDAHAGAEQGVKELQNSGFDMKKLSIVGKNPHAEEHVVGFYNAGDRIKTLGQRPARFLGWDMGPARWSGVFRDSRHRTRARRRPLVAWIVGALEGAVVVGGVGAIGAGLFSIGVPKDSVLNYEVALKTDRFLLLVHGTADEAARAREILKGTHPAELHTHPLETAEPEHADRD